MALFGCVVLLAVQLRISTADVSLKVQPEVIGTWKSSVVLPCSYSPVDLPRHRVTWLFNGERIFESDGGGDHTFITKYRGRLSLSQDRKGGNVSLTIMDLQTDDRGAYTCKVSLMPQGTTEPIQNGAEINLDVRRVAVTKPFIQPRGTTLKASQGSTVTLTCSAEGSPPITYRWYKRSSSGSPTYTASGTSFTIANADPSHSGIYFCDAENKSPEKTVQRSEELELSVTDVAVEPTNTPDIAMHSSVGMVTSNLPASAGDDRHRSSAPASTEDGTLRQTPHSTHKTNVIVGPTGSPGDRRPQTTDPAGRGGLPLYLIILIVVLCFAVLCALVAVLATRRRHKGSGQISEMPAMSALNAQANQAPPAVNICQLNISQNNGCQNVTMARIENVYGPPMTQEPEQDDSAYQNLLTPHENEYELPETKKEKMYQL